MAVQDIVSAADAILTKVLMNYHELGMLYRQDFKCSSIISTQKFSSSFPPYSEISALSTIAIVLSVTVDLCYISSMHVGVPGINVGMIKHVDLNKQILVS